MPIQVTCSACHSSFNAPDSAAGKRAKCPKCGGVIEIPQPVAVAIEDEILEAEPVAGSAFSDEDFAEPVAAMPLADRKPCPMCGEMIQKDAVKCRYCGEVFDPAMRGRLSTGDARDPAWRRVRSGLSTMYNAIVILLISAIAIGICAVVGAAMSGPGGGRDMPAGMIILFIVGGLAILGAAIAMLVGQVMCAGVPANSGARGFANGAVICLVLNFVLNMAGTSMHNQAVSGFGSLVSVVGHVLFILFIRQSATYLGNLELASSAGKFLVFGISLFACTFVGFFLAGAAGAPAIAGIVGIAVIIAGLIGFVWYLRLLKSLISTIDERTRNF